MKRQLPFALVFIFGLFMVFQYFVPREESEWIYEFLLDWIYIIGILALALGIWSLVKVSADKIEHRRPNWGYAYITICGLFAMIVFGFSARNGNDWGWFFVFVALALGFVLFLLHGLMRTASSRSRGISLLLSLVCLGGAILIGLFDNAWSLHFYTDVQKGLQSTMFRAFFDYVMIPIMSTMFSLLAFFIASAAYRAFRARNLLATLLLFAALIVMLRFNPYFGPVSYYINKTSNWLMNVPNLAAQRAIVIGIGLGIVATALKVILGIERGYMGRG
jgi:hypothetical protein